MFISAAQEDELARLYDILETQRDEIENLNQILDHLAQQGPDGGKRERGREREKERERERQR